MTIFLCGFMGCGKSTIGNKLAKTLQCPFTDMDTYIEEQAGMKIPEIFEKYGEPHFRDLETQAVRDLSGQEGIIACGGGAMLREINAEIARENGMVLFLDVPFRICYQRIANTDRPIVRSNDRQGLYQLYRKRKVVYKRHSTHQIGAVGTPSAIVQMILALPELASQGETQDT